MKIIIESPQPDEEDVVIDESETETTLLKNEQELKSIFRMEELL